ncbi:MAG TPA: class I SAM-dependent methyltransferase [Methylibium sp.]|nr:class I SAM-dependent methyltransferase [Methylibium sp.]
MSADLQPGGPVEADADDATRPHGPRRIHAQLTRHVVGELVRADAHRVLELGCGDGWFAGALDRCGYELTGVDTSGALLSAARRRYPHLRFEQGDATQRPAAAHAGVFDAVVAIDLLDHVTSPRQLVAHAMAALRPGGVLILSASFHGYAKNLALALGGRFDARWEPLTDDGRLKFFSRGTLTALLSEFELRELRMRTVGRVPMFARAMLVSARLPARALPSR